MFDVDFAKIVSSLGDNVIQDLGAQVGLDGDQSVRVAHALAARIGQGREAAIAGAAEDAGLTQEVVQAMAAKLYEAGRDKLMADSGIAAGIESAKEEAMDAVKTAAGGFFSRLFKRA